ncbi:MAG: hypothetical protein EOP09_07370 [Proteobacteria bacterium]|nr:MAG: hypothetical protein EOP09_07370 [Pseudomonadota bacterium]
MWSPVLFVISLGLIQNAGMAFMLTERVPTRSDVLDLMVSTVFGMLPLLSGIYAFSRAQRLKLPQSQKRFLSKMLVILAIGLSLLMQYLGWRQVRLSPETQLVFLFFPFYASMAHLAFSQVILAFYQHE